jgi:undecaprenyl pyrophosphate phosphatase UppP
VSHLSYVQAMVIGLLQGVSELFPVSSLGHSIIIPALIGGDWARNLNMTADKSPYLSFVVAVHVATAVALIVFYRRDWARIISGLFSSIRNRRISTSSERLGWLLIAATVPVGLVGLAFERVIRTTLGRPVVAALFLTLNGVLLYAVERLRSRSSAGAHRTDVHATIAATTTALGTSTATPRTTTTSPPQVCTPQGHRRQRPIATTRLPRRPMTASAAAAGASPSQSGPRRSSPCCPDSAVPARLLPPGWFAA